MLQTGDRIASVSSLCAPAACLSRISFCAAPPRQVKQFHARTVSVHTKFAIGRPSSHGGSVTVVTLPRGKTAGHWRMECLRAVNLLHAVSTSVTWFTVISRWLPRRTDSIEHFGPFPGAARRIGPVGCAPRHANAVTAFLPRMRMNRQEHVRALPDGSHRCAA